MDKMKRYDTVEAGAEPVSAADLAIQIRGTAASETSYLTSLAKVARQQVEKHCRIAVIRKTITMFMDRFPSECSDDWWDGVRDISVTELYKQRRQIELPLPPLISVTSITTYDDSDTAVVFASTQYYVDASTKNQQGRIVLRQGAPWPIALRMSNAVKVIYETGYVDGAVPEDLKLAIMGVGAYLYANRGDCSGEPVEASGAGALCQSYMIREPR